MWIVPKNYQPSFPFAQDMVGSKEELEKLGPLLMWRSKPSPLKTWLTRWKRGDWFQHLCGRMLKHSHQKYFEIVLTSSLLDIRANRLARLEKEQEQTTQDTCGPTSGNMYRQLNLPFATSKTWKDTSRLDSPQFSAIWKRMVIRQRGEYSQRLKSGHHIKEKGCLSWPTVTVAEAGKISCQANYGQIGLSNHPAIVGLPDREKNNKSGKPQGWLTPRVLEIDEPYEKYISRMANSGNPKNVGKTRPSNLTMQVGAGKLNPDWVEQLMGLEVGWTGTGNRIDRLRLLGNGVVPQTAEKAFKTLMGRFTK